MTLGFVSKISVVPVAKKIFPKSGTTVETCLREFLSNDNKVMGKFLEKTVILPKNHKLRQLGFDKFVTSKNLLHNQELKVDLFDKRGYAVMPPEMDLGASLKEILKYIKNGEKYYNMIRASLY